jgi:hypothetical protein
MGKSKLSKKGQAEEQSFLGKLRKQAPSAPPVGPAGGTSPGPMVRQDTANDQRMNEIARKGREGVGQIQRRAVQIGASNEAEQARAAVQPPRSPSLVGRQFSWQR